MSIWKRVQSALPDWPWNKKTPQGTSDAGPGQQLPGQQAQALEHLLQAHTHLRDLLEDTSIPSSVRAELATEFEQVQAIADKVAREEIHIAAFGRVGVGKSTLLNALLGKTVFSTSPLHGETRDEGRSRWIDPAGKTSERRDGQVVLIDTPGIDEAGGEKREALAQRIADRADIVMMVCQGDLVEKEITVLMGLAAKKPAVVLVLNKADQFTAGELQLVLARLRDRTAEFLPEDRVVAVSAAPRPANRSGEILEPDVADLRGLLWSILERRGKSLTALNAALFAADLDRQIASRIVEARQAVTARIVRNYCISKGLLVAVNPVPVADLLAAAGSDVAMVVHLGQVYGFQLNRRESAKLLLTISAQLVALMGAYWGTNLLSSLLKGASAGLSTTLTAATQGALAWYATLVTGRMAEAWFSQGKSWGGRGPRETAREIIASLDREEVLTQARDALAAKLNG